MSIDKNFDSNILERIKEDNLKPKPKWTFLFKDSVIWFFGALSLVFGALGVSVIIYLLKNNDWSLYNKLSGSFLEFILLTMPYFWILFLAIFILVIKYNIQHTKKGYKYSLPIIVFSII